MVCTTLTPVPLLDCISRIPNGVALALLRDHPCNVVVINGCPRICPTQNISVDTGPIKVDVAVRLCEEEDAIDSSCKGKLQARNVKREVNAPHSTSYRLQKEPCVDGKQYGRLVTVRICGRRTGGR